MIEKWSEMRGKLDLVRVSGVQLLGRKLNAGLPLYSPLALPVRKVDNVLTDQHYLREKW